MESHFYFTLTANLYVQWMKFLRANLKLCEESMDAGPWQYQLLFPLTSLPPNRNLYLLISTWLLACLPFLESLPCLKILGLFTFSFPHCAVCYLI